MARYIDADVLKQFLHEDDFGTPDERWKPESEFAQMIDALPTANVAEVVRCKDCKSYNTNSCADGFGWCEEMDCGKMDNFYCSYGEKALKERESK